MEEQAPDIVPQVHKASARDAVIIDIDQTELHEAPKSLQERLQRTLKPLTKLTLYPFARIDCRTMQVLTQIKDEDDKLVLQLEHKSNLKWNEPCTAKATFGSLFEMERKEEQRGDNARSPGKKDTIDDSSIMRFLDDRGNLIFTSVSYQSITKVICDNEVLGTINSKALRYTSTPNLMAMDENGKIILEIPINPGGFIPRPKQDYLEVHSNHGNAIGIIGRDESHKSGCQFGVTITQALDESSKAVFLTSAFLLYTVILSKTRTAGPCQIESSTEGSTCCILNWNIGKSAPVVLTTLAMAVILVTLTVTLTTL